MADFLQYGYVVLWAVLAVLMIFVGKRQGVYGYLLSLFFVFMAVWYGLRAFGGFPVFEGVPGYIFRGLLIGFLLVIAYVWYRSKKKDPKSDTDEAKE